MGVVGLLAAAFLLTQDLEPGLVAEYFELEKEPAGLPSPPAGRAPVFVRVEPVIDHGFVTGAFHGTKLLANFHARWTGVLRVTKEGLHGFYVESDDGCRLSIAGETVIDNRDGRAMEQKSERVILPAGDHALVFEFFQAGGPAGCNLQWKPPGQGRQKVPPAVLFHKKGAEAAAWDRAAWEKRPDGPPMEPVKVERPGQYALTDYGPFLTRSVEGPKDVLTQKGLAIRVGPEAAVCFDTDLLRWSVAWTGKYLNYPTGRDGIQGHPAVGGTIRFATKPGSPGWSKDGGWKDPRALPHGPLPRDWAKWRGLYLHGRTVVLSYNVGGCDVLESPGFENGAFTRTFRLGPSRVPQSVLLAEGEIEGGLVGAPEGAALRRRDGRLELELPARAGPLTFKVSLPKTDVAPAADLAALVKGGPARWTAPVVTKGAPGREPGAYVVDTLTVPFDNPWDSYLRLSAVDFFADGRAAVGTLDGDVWIVSGIAASLEKLTWKRFATGLYQALGLRVVDGRVYALGRDQITRLHDLDGDGEADFYENFNNDSMVSASFHEFAMDLQTDPEGNFYFAKAASLGYAAGTPHNGTLLKVAKDGSTLEVLATGLRAPNGLCVGPRGELTSTDQQGNWMPVCPINWMKPGGFYGFQLEAYPGTKTQPRDPPLCWIPMDVDNSSGGQVWVPGDRWGPLAGKLLHLSYGQARLFTVLVDEGSSPLQGGVARLPLQFQSGIMRARFSPADGQLYVVGMRGWQTTGVKEGCLQRVRYTGKPANLPAGLRVRKTGVDLAFTDPLDRGSAADVENFSAEWFRVESTADYGSPEFNVSDPRKRGREPVSISAARLSEDGRTVSLEIPSLRPVTNLVIKFTLRGADGSRLSHAVPLTIHRLPEK